MYKNSLRSSVFPFLFSEPDYQAIMTELSKIANAFYLRRCICPFAAL